MTDLVKLVDTHLGAEVRRAAAAYAKSLDTFDDRHFEQVNTNSASAGALWAVNSPVACWFLVKLQETVGLAVGQPVWSRYAVLRAVQPGEVVRAHVDGAIAANVVVFLPLYCEGAPWAVELHVDGAWVGYAPKVGEMLVIRNKLVRHRRPAFTGRRYIGCLLGYSTRSDRGKAKKFALSNRELIAASTEGRRRLLGDAEPVNPGFSQNYVRERSVYAMDVLSREEAACVREAARALPAEVPSAGGAVRRDIRRGAVRWINPGAAGDALGWLFDRVKRSAMELNGTYFGFDVAFARPIALQYTEYPAGAFYTSHVDMFFRHGGFMERKLGFSMLLSRPDEFTGGELVIENEPVREDLQQATGALIVFPSFVPHEVRPVASGTRISLVGWFEGPLWR